MARIAKPGLDYFPFDVDLFQDIRIRKLIKRQGGKAVAVYALLLCLIYKNGYFMQWDNELPFIGSEMSGFDEAYISEVIKACLALGLFDKNLFDSDRVLTSRGIQLRYRNIQRLNKRMARIDRYSLLNDPAPRASADSQPDPVNAASASLPQHAPEQEPEPTFIPPDPPDAAPPAALQNHVPDRNAEWLDEFFADNNRENLQMLCKNYHLQPGQIPRLRSLAEEVVAEWTLSQTRHYNYSDWSRHLIAVMRIKNRDSNKSLPPVSDYTFKGGFGGKDV